MQENNHIAIVDLATGKVIGQLLRRHRRSRRHRHQEGRRHRPYRQDRRTSPREPDGVQWIDDDRFVTANEGDWKGGSRGFTIFNDRRHGRLRQRHRLRDMAVRLGHYPEKRNKKGNEPEGAEVATFGDDRLIFVGSERALAGRRLQGRGRRQGADLPAGAARRHRPGRPARHPRAQPVRHRRRERPARGRPDRLGRDDL